MEQFYRKMKLCYVVLFFICVNVASTQDKGLMHLELNGQSYNIPNFAEIEGSLPSSNRKPISKRLDFEKIIYVVNEERQKLRKGYKIPCNIVTTQEISIKGSFVIVDHQTPDMASHFQAINDKQKVTVEVKDDIPEENLKTTDSLIFILKFIPEQSEEDFIYTILVIFLRTEQLNQPKKINFDEINYKIAIYPEYIGIMKQIVAKLDKNDDKATIVYSLIFENDKDDILKNSLKINELTGILEKTRSLPPGLHSFKISAKINADLHTEVDVTLNAIQAVVCDSDKAKFLYAQVVKHFPEGKTGDILESLVDPDDKCTYKIASQMPKGDYFELNEKTAGLKLQKGVKLDTKIFKDPKNAKFVIKLLAHCDTNAADDNTAKKGANQQSLTDDYFDIPYNPNEMSLILYIDEPTPSIFSTEKIIVGYPKDYDVIMSYNVPFVTSAHTHTNEPNNAIRYSIVEENCPFSVHSSKGDIYPSNFYNGDKDYTLTILAKDATRKTEGKLSVTIKFLAESELVEAMFVDTAADIGKLLRDCGTKVGMEITPLTQAVVPITDDAKNSDKIPNDKKQTRLWRTLCYAIDEKDKNFVQGEIIVDKLKSSSAILIAEMVSLRTTDSKVQDGELNSYLLIAGIVIATSLALAFIAGTTYLIVTRRRHSLIRNSAHTSTIPLDDDMKASGGRHWKSSPINVYSTYDNVSADPWPTPDLPASSVSYSNANEEVVIIDTREASNELLPSGVSTFRRDTSNEHPSSSINFTYHDLQFPPTTGESSTSNNVLVSSSPSQSNERKKTNKGK